MCCRGPWPSRSGGSGRLATTLYYSLVRHVMHVLFNANFSRHLLYKLEAFLQPYLTHPYQNVR